MLKRVNKGQNQNDQIHISFIFEMLHKLSCENMIVDFSLKQFDLVKIMKTCLSLYYYYFLIKKLYLIKKFKLKRKGYTH